MKEKYYKRRAYLNTGYSLNSDNKEGHRYFLLSLLESINEGIIVVSLEGIILFFNRKASEITGINTFDAINNDYREIFNTYLTPVDLYYRGEKQEIRKFTNGEEERIILVERFEVKDDFGEVIGIVERLEDITKIRELEDRIQYVKQVSQLGEMASFVAHEIKNSLTSLEGYFSLLKRKIEQDDIENIKRLSQKVETAIISIKEVTENVLSFAKPVKVEIINIILHDAIIEIVKMMEKESEILGRKLEVRCLIPLYIHICMSKGHLHEVISNIIRNSIESMPEGGTCIVSIEAKKERGYIKLIIKDNGPGIPPSIKDKIFRPFFSTKKGGTGLGLVISKRIVESYGGSIELEESSKGACFVITFPIREEI